MGRCPAGQSQEFTLRSRCAGLRLSLEDARPDGSMKRTSLLGAACLVQLRHESLIELESLMRYARMRHESRPERGKKARATCGRFNVFSSLHAKSSVVGDELEQQVVRRGPAVDPQRGERR